MMLLPSRSFLEESERKLNYLLAQCGDYCLDVTPPETVEGLLKQLELVSELDDVNLSIENIKKQIAE